ncbi:hypothetical protein BJ508DRAFT_413003 [Ascobolus immersus RN42]|uniref:Uncharacterized protein n=1 Tax=Ascobolus immersus RN42 TaxID=1160509 RepID=A0A3N4IEF9_ASCIM|nr:hypothetical protein BJ508DRAFT_413003 [Ascobolus immersus RN42]
MGSLLRLTPGQARAFSTTLTRPALSPYSPNYIEIPKPEKVIEPRTPRPKGFIPRPRKIFRRTGEDKSSWAYIARATPPSTTATTRGPRISQTNDSVANLTKLQVAQKIQWERAMAESRRKNLREGLIELHERYVWHQQKREARSRERREQREALLHAAEKDDVRLTLPTLLSTDALIKQDLYKIAQKNRLEDKKTIYEAKQAQKARERQKMLHELYVNARDFIVTEEQLDAAIEKEFAQTFSGQMGTVTDPREMLQRTADAGRQYVADTGKPASAEVGEAIMGGAVPEEKKTDVSQVEVVDYRGSRSRGAWRNRVY